MEIIQFFIRSAAAVVIGCLIGCERVRHGRAAGMRTHILVCLGACMTSLTGVYVNNILGINGDVFRIPAQVVSGIGFLGAGMIILKSNNVIKGLTTAAGIWTTGTIGIALGYGFYSGAVIVTFLFIGTITLFAKFERKNKSTEIIYIEIDNAYRLNEILEELEKIIPETFSYQISAPKSNCSGNVGINLAVNKFVKIDTEVILKLPNIVFAIEDE